MGCNPVTPNGVKGEDILEDVDDGEVEDVDDGEVENIDDGEVEIVL